jgi:hypothetical protein
LFFDISLNRYLSGFGGNGFGIGLGLVLGTGAGVKFTPGVVPVESLLARLVGTGLFLETLPARVVWQLVAKFIYKAEANKSHIAFFFIVYYSDI